MSEWRIYYDDGTVVRGYGERQWVRAPDNGVQVVVLMEPPVHPHWTYAEDGIRHTVWDRKLWTGSDSYDPFGWGDKTGTLMDDDAYMATWNRACTD